MKSLVHTAIFVISLIKFTLANESDTNKTFEESDQPEFLDEFLDRELYGGTTEPPHDSLTGDYKINAKLPKYTAPKINPTDCLHGNTKSKYVHPDLKLTCLEIIEKYDYDLEKYEDVKTEDGYILTLFRIKGSPKSPPKPGKIPVLLVHGLMGDCMSWLFLSTKKSLAFKLADAGYDVFLFNARGTSYSQRHKSLKTTSDAYWDFSFHEIGHYDVPATIDYILNVTEQRDLYYVGHSLGSTFYMIALSEKPEYGLKIRVGFLLGPLGLVMDMTNPALTFLLKVGTTRYDVWKTEFGASLSPKVFNAAFTAGQTVCPKEAGRCGLCSNYIFASSGLNMKQLNGSVVFFFSARYMDTTSSKLFCHLSQLYQNNKYANWIPKFDYNDKKINTKKYGQKTVPSYDLSRITAPTVSFWGLGDNITPPGGVKKTMELFPPEILKENNRIPDPKFTHFDFILANDVNHLVYNRIQFIMDQKLYVDKGKQGQLDFRETIGQDT